MQKAILSTKLNKRSGNFSPSVLPIYTHCKIKESSEQSSYGITPSLHMGHRVHAASGISCVTERNSTAGP